MHINGYLLCKRRRDPQQACHASTTAASASSRTHPRFMAVMGFFWPPLDAGPPPR